MFTNAFVVRPLPLFLPGLPPYRTVGNQTLRLKIQNSVNTYEKMRSKREKSEFVASIVNMIRSSNPTGGGFVRKDYERGRWIEIGETRAREKVGHAIRIELRKRKRNQRRAFSSSSTTSSSGHPTSLLVSGEEEQKGHFLPLEGKEAGSSSFPNFPSARGAAVASSSISVLLPSLQGSLTNYPAATLLEDNTSQTNPNKHAKKAQSTIFESSGSARGVAFLGEEDDDVGADRPSAGLPPDDQASKVSPQIKNPRQRMAEGIFMEQMGQPSSSNPGQGAPVFFNVPSNWRLIVTKQENIEQRAIEPPRSRPNSSNALNTEKEWRRQLEGAQASAGNADLLQLGSGVPDSSPILSPRMLPLPNHVTVLEACRRHKKEEEEERRQRQARNSSLPTPGDGEAMTRLCSRSNAGFAPGGERCDGTS